MVQLKQVVWLELIKQHIQYIMDQQALVLPVQISQKIQLIQLLDGERVVVLIVVYVIILEQVVIYHQYE
jgi:hypothetical protein